MLVAGVDAWRQGWVGVWLEDGRLAAVRAEVSLAALLAPDAARDGSPGAAGEGRTPGAGGEGGTPGAGGEGGTRAAAGIDMPLGLLESGWREADRVARGLLGPRRGSVFAIPPRAVWAQQTYPAANRCCRELTGQGLSIQAWGLRAKLLEANACRRAHQLYEVHPELAFSAMAGAPLEHSKHTAAGRELRRELLARTGIIVPDAVGPVPVTDVLDAAAVAWSAWRIATGRAVTLPGQPQHDRDGYEIAIRY